MDLKFSIFIFVYLFYSDKRRPLTNIKPKKIIKISYFDQEIQFFFFNNLLTLYTTLIHNTTLVCLLTQLTTIIQLQITQEIQLLQCQNLLLKTEFVQISLYYISRLNQDIKELFSVLSLFQDRLSTTDIKSLTIYILKFHFKSFARQKYKQQKI